MRIPAAIILTVMILSAFSACSNDNPVTPTAGNGSIENLTPQAYTTPAQTTEEPDTPDTGRPTPNASAPVTENTATPAPDPPDLKVVGYITHWHFNRLPGLNLEGLTHIIWQGVEVTNSGNPDLRVANDEEWEQITELVKIGHSRNIKVLASLIGPWNKSDLNEILKSGEQRKKLVENIKALVESYELDGIDIDNENTPPNKITLSIFIKELYEILSPLGKIITMAGHHSDVRIYRDTFHCVDFFNLMTYDMAKGIGYPYHSTIEESIQALDYWAKAGVPKEKLLMGIPLYGRDSKTGFYEYRWIVEKYNPSPDQNEVPEPAAAGGVIWWNGIGLVKEKTIYAKENGYGGVMLYEIGTDSHGDFSLLKSVFQALEEPPGTGTVPGEPGQEGN